MPKMNTWSNALFDAYLSQYAAAQQDAVNSGASAQKKAVQRGSAVMNATDKTLPEIKDYSGDINKGILKTAANEGNLALKKVSAANTQAKRYFDAAQKQSEEDYAAAKKAAEEAASAAQKAYEEAVSGAKKLAESAAKQASKTTKQAAAKQATAKQTTTKAASGDKTAASGNKASAGKATTGKTAGKTSGGNATGKASSGNTATTREAAKSTKQTNTAKQTTSAKNGTKASATEKKTTAKQVASNYAMGNSTANATNTGYAAAGQDGGKTLSTVREAQRTRQSAALTKLRKDAEYGKELASYGRTLTPSEQQAARQYLQETPKTSELYKQYQAGKLDIDSYNQQAGDRARLEQKLSLNGLGQGLQAFTAGLANSAPLVDTLERAVNRDNEAYKNVQGGALVTDQLAAAQQQDPVLGAAGYLTGTVANYNALNGALAGTKLAQAMSGAGNKAVDAARRLPVLNRVLGAGAGDALGRILTDSSADLLLDTVPSLADDVQTYNAQQQAAEQGAQLENPLTPGQIGLNALGNIGLNVGLNMVPELGAAALKRIGEARQSAKTALDAQVPLDAQAVQTLPEILPERLARESLSESIEPQTLPGSLPEGLPQTLPESLVPDALRQDIAPVNTVDAAGLRAAAGGQTADGVQTPGRVADGLPENGIGAMKSEFDRSLVPNQDIANQRAAVAGLDEAHTDELDDIHRQPEHQLWTDAEAKQQGLEDVDLYIQQAGGDADAGLRDAMADLRTQDVWDKGQTKTAKQVQQRLKDAYAKAEPGTEEFYLRAAENEAWSDTISDHASKAGQNLQAYVDAPVSGDTGRKKLRQVTDEVVQEFERANPQQSEELRKMAQELERLQQQLIERDIADMEREAQRGMFGDGQSVPRVTGDAILAGKGAQTASLFDEAVEDVRDLSSIYGLTLDDEAAKRMAGKLLSGDTSEGYYRKLAQTAAGIEDLSLDELAQVDELFDRIAKLPDSKERYELESQAYSILASKLPAKTWSEKFNNYRYLAMLGNPRTHVRNLMGNLTMQTVVRAKDRVAAVMELALPKNQRTKTVLNYLDADDRALEAAAKSFADSNVWSELRGTSKYNAASGIAAARKTYGDSVFGRTLQKLTDFNSGLLEKEDAIFLKSNFSYALARELKAKGFDASIFDANDGVSQAVLENAAQRAVDYAKVATFHQDNWLSKEFSNLSSNSKGNGAGGKLMHAIVEGIIPFKKTPINIAKSALEYTPVGGAVQAVARAAKRQSANEVIDAAAKGITGTGIIGAGYLLAKAGWLNGSGSGNDKVEKYQSMLGQQDYSVKLPNGDTYTLDWMSPAAVPLLIGAELANDSEEYTNVLQALDVMRHSLQPVFDTTMLQGMNDALDSVSYADTDEKLTALASSALTNFGTQFVPTALGQVARSVDPLRRSTYGGGDSKNARDLTYLQAKIENKVPGLSQTNEPYIDQWGRTEASLDGTESGVLGTVARLGYNMLSPGFYSKSNVTPVDELVQDLYDQTGDTKALPSLSKKYVTVDGANKWLTPEQHTEYATIRGQTAYNMLDVLRKDDSFNDLPADAKAKIVSDVYTLAGQTAASEVVPGYKSSNKALEIYQEQGEEMALSWYLYKAGADENQNSRISQAEAQAMLDSMDLTREGRALLWEKTNAGWKTNPYR